jgi:hypothetical protein
MPTKSRFFSNFGTEIHKYKIIQKQPLTTLGGGLSSLVPKCPQKNACIVTDFQ